MKHLSITSCLLTGFKMSGTRETKIGRKRLESERIAEKDTEIGGYILVQSIHRWTHHKLQQKGFLRIHYQKGLRNNILKM